MFEEIDKCKITSTMDEDGFLFIVDCKKDMIVTGGSTSSRVRSRTSSPAIRRWHRLRWWVFRTRSGPLTPLGKLDKKVLRAWHWAGATRAV